MKARSTKKPPDLIAAGARWRKVEKAQTWRPGDGEVLQGSLVSTRTREGSYGTYSLHTIKSESGLFSVSGAVISALLGDAGVKPGDVVRIVFLGRKQGASNEYKDFELYVAV